MMIRVCQFEIVVVSAAGWYFFCIVVGIVLGVAVALGVPRCIRYIRLRKVRSGYGTMHEDA